MLIPNKWNYTIGTEFHFFNNEKGFIIEDMIYKGKRKNLYLMCRCLECGKLKCIRADSILQEKGSVSHKYCNIISKGIGTEYDNSEFYKKTRTAFYSAHNRCENPKYPCYNRYHNRGIIVSDNFSKTDDGLRNWLNYLVPMLQDRINYGISNNEFIDVEDALTKLSLDRIDDNGNYDYNNMRWVTSEVQIQNRNCMNNFYAIDPEGNIYISNNITRFAKDFNLVQSNISRCIINPNYSHKGWKFYLEDKLFRFDYNNSNIINKMY